MVKSSNDKKFKKEEFVNLLNCIRQHPFQLQVEEDSAIEEILQNLEKLEKKLAKKKKLEHNVKKKEIVLKMYKD